MLANVCFDAATVQLNSAMQSVMSLHQSYFVEETIGTGGFSVVKKCRDKKTNEIFAAKIVNTKRATRQAMQDLETEARLCLQLQHTNIVRLFHHFPDSSFYYFIFELVTGGELFDNIVERECYSEIDASICIQQVLDAVAFCHSKGIIHRDIKPENLLLANREPNAKVKLTDFGLAVEGGNTPSWHGFAGTPCYMAPEVLRQQPYGTAVDCWAIGCMLYVLLTGYPPFWNSSKAKLYETIKEGAYDFESPIWRNVSFDAKTLIRMLLTVNPNRRVSASKALFSRWISKRERSASRKHRKSTVQSLQAFNARRKFIGAIQTTILATASKISRRHSSAS